MRWHGSDFDIARVGPTLQGMLGFGANSGSGFGIGVEGGWTLPAHIYLGGNFTYFFGSALDSAYLLEFQGGYDLAVIKQAPVLIRPYAGLGYEHFSEGAAACGSLAGTNLCDVAGGGGSFVISLGAVGSYFFTRNFFAGVDLRIDIPTAGYGWTVFDGFAIVGYKF
jgi:hypothetical protein